MRDSGAERQRFTCVCERERERLGQTERGPVRDRGAERQKLTCVCVRERERDSDKQREAR